MVLLARVRMFLEMIKFSHTVFALPFALLSATLAWQEKPFHILDLIGLLLCMAFARSAAMAFNRIADQRYDAVNPRTALRHLPSGQLTTLHVWFFAVICMLGFIASTFIFTHSGNYWPLMLSIPVLSFLLLYSFTKRFTVMAHAWLGASLMLAPIAAWIAICGLENLKQPVILGLAVLFWVTGFDIIYACQDVDVDRKLGLFSVPARFGVHTALRLAALCHFLMLGCLIALWAVSPHLGLVFIAGVGAVGILLVWEHWLVRPDDLRRVNEAFFYVNGIISVGLLVLVWVQIAVKSG